MTSGQVFRNTVIVLATIASAYVLLYSVRVIILLLMAILIASALRPMIVRLTHLRISYGLAVLLTYGIVLGFTVFMLVLVLPPVFNQFASYLDRESLLANQIIRVQTWLEQTAFNMTGDPISLGNEDQIRTEVSRLVNQIRTAMPDLLTGLGSIIGEAILVVVIGLYWLTSRDKTVDFLVSLFARRRREVVIESIDEIEHSMGNYIRGVVLVALFVGIMNAIILSLLRVPNAVTLGFIVGVTTMLPVVGGFIGGLGATFLAALTSPLNGVLTLATFVGVQQIETHYLTPRVMSRSVGLDPILIITAIFIGFSLYGVMGAILAVPVLGALGVLLRRLVIEPRQTTAAATTYKTEQGAVILDAPTPIVPPESVLVKPTA